MIMRNKMRLAVFCFSITAAAAHAGGAEPIRGAIGETKLILDTRLRMESVDQDGVANDADAVTLRVRLGLRDR